MVSVNGLSAGSGTLDFDDFLMARRFNPMRAYARSKLALTLFAVELQRRSDEAGWGLLSCAAHPGLSPTGILAGAIASERRRSLVYKLHGIVGHPPGKAAASIVYAATSDAAEPGRFYGPAGFGQLRGPPRQVRCARAHRDLQEASRLWEMSQTLTSHPFPR